MLKTENEEILRICGTCIYSSPRLEYSEIQYLRRKVHFRQRYITGLILSKRLGTNIRPEIFCNKENMKVGTLEKVCAFWQNNEEPALYT